MLSDRQETLIDPFCEFLKNESETVTVSIRIFSGSHGKLSQW